jgi:hypothetical protein
LAFRIAGLPQYERHLIGQHIGILILGRPDAMARIVVDPEQHGIAALARNASAALFD